MPEPAQSCPSQHWGPLPGWCKETCPPQAISGPTSHDGSPTTRPAPPSICFPDPCSRQRCCRTRWVTRQGAPFMPPVRPPIVAGWPYVPHGLGFDISGHPGPTGSCRHGSGVRLGAQWMIAWRWTPPPFSGEPFCVVGTCLRSLTLRLAPVRWGLPHLSPPSWPWPPLSPHSGPPGSGPPRGGGA